MLTPQIWLAPIPRLFWSEYSEEPFAACADCNEPLEQSGFHVIQKSFVGGETVFELAVCNRCRDNLNAQCSEETIQAMETWFHDHVADREAPFDSNSDVNEVLQHCVDQCLACGRKREECHRYSIAGLCRELDVVIQLSQLGQSPVMICHECEQQASHLVSKKTRDAWDRFVEDKLDGPPGIDLDIPDGYPVLL